LISFSNIHKQYGKQLIFVDASFQLNPGEKVGLVGPNGAGKTTLFRMVVGEESPDEGEVSVPKKLTIGYFRQDVEEMQGRSVLDEAIAGSGRAGDLHHELEDLQRAMEDPARADDMDRILERFGHVQEEYDHLGGYALEAQAREALHGLGFQDDQIDGDVGALSGGWKMRVALARVLLGRPDALLMDEPTNHLDIESIIWLEQFLKSYPGAVLMTSHDREFLNRIVSRIAEIDAGRSSRTRATTISTSASAPSARPISRRPSPVSKPCWPRNSALSTVSGRTRPRRRRCKAASRRWTRSKKSSCRKNVRW
jgi:ATPase subunit of ABC transporter with duplicated ATPase domains